MGVSCDIVAPWKLTKFMMHQLQIFNIHSWLLVNQREFPSFDSPKFQNPSRVFEWLITCSRNLRFSPHLLTKPKDSILEPLRHSLDAIPKHDTEATSRQHHNTQHQPPLSQSTYQAPGPKPATIPPRLLQPPSHNHQPTPFHRPYRNRHLPASPSAFPPFAPGDVVAPSLFPSTSILHRSHPRPRKPLVPKHRSANKIRTDLTQQTPTIPPGPTPTKPPPTRRQLSPPLEYRDLWSRRQWLRHRELFERTFCVRDIPTHSTTLTLLWSDQIQSRRYESRKDPVTLVYVMQV